MGRAGVLIVVGMAWAAALALGGCSGDNSTNTTEPSATSGESGYGASDSSMTANPGAPQNSGAAPGASRPPS